MTNAVAVIPARYASTRFPGKVLARLGAKPLIQWVWEAVAGSGLFSQVAVATDSELVLQAVKDFGGMAILTREDHPSGSDRVAEAVRLLEGEIVVNVQGDEPNISREVLLPLLESFRDPEVRMASLMTELTKPDDIDNPNIVKVVVGQTGNALYFSRSIIPFDRDASGFNEYWRHIGVYAWRRETLFRFVALPPGKLEQVEKLEQLRALEHGIPIRMVPTAYQGIGVDTPEDLVRVQSLLEE
jgi:3-deoxy-manno-octulosonate cytidylyltransferase (CMP-KDO synthetase)